MNSTIRHVNLAKESSALWEMMEPILRAGETYALPRDWNQEEALQYWCHDSHEVFVSVQKDETTGKEEIVGTYFLHANQKAGGSHVANCGYMTKTGLTGKGVARRMCEHSLEYAKNKGFRSMQYNFVVKSNERAVKLWQSMGFQIVGELPEAFDHPKLGYTNAYVMYRHL
jgi:ribosomal protein S18 acetylase RimI-like enzyme